METLEQQARTIQFAEQAVQFEFDSPDLLKFVDVHFRHCTGDTDRIVGNYRVQPEKDSWFSILKDGSSWMTGLTRDQALSHLMQDALAQLNGASKTHLIFHSAALAFQGRGVLLCGGSGSGKSTLAAWLMRKNFQYLTDEVTAYPVSGGEVEGFCRSLVLKAGSSFVVESLVRNGRVGNLLQMADGSAWVPPSLLGLAGVRAQVHPHVILFPAYSPDAELQIEPLSPSRTLFLLLQGLVNARNFADHGMAAAKKLSQTVSAYRVAYPDVQQVSEWIQKTILI